MSFFNSGFYWFLNGMLFILVIVGFKILTQDRGWKATWWKWLLTAIWYFILALTFYAWGTLAGENFASAGFTLLIVGLIVCIILGVGLWRLWVMGSKSTETAEPAEPAEPAAAEA